MAYSNFTLSEVIKQFNLTLKDKENLFGDIPRIECSDYLAVTLKYNVSLASEINTEKARSELIIAPILVELRRKLNDQVSLFSGKEFTANCDQMYHNPGKVER